VILKGDRLGFELSQPQRIIAVGLAFEVGELPTLGAVDHLHGVPGGTCAVVNPSGVGAGLDDDRATEMSGEQAGQVRRRGVECPEGVLTGAPIVNAGDAVVPTQIDGDNRLIHRKLLGDVKATPSR
jgi:hypothetical protein